ncbi:uncharacterized protein LOC125240544 isoform X3 [Leguminivora glycinivorella]|uniref:uncharacterized protein LOC125240544 isoform X3 n=1 Tax=Leguminivora glycinivorella TaxID=1035111 RepID=UPI00200CE3FE|nr:uncharacterized protein LOC125240544 isoform X3 [Leguminivora glycinivorella]
MTRFSHDSAPNASSAPPYELTASAGSCADAGGALLPAQPHQPHSSQPRHDPRKRKDKHFGADRYEMSSCEPSLHAPAIPSSPSSHRKRKGSSYGAGSACDDDDGDDTRSTLTLPDKKQNHSEIEKRRRDKMNTYITELSAMIPMCGAMARKLDKLTVLRMAVQHLRSVRGALSACPLTARPRPAFLSERELNELILQAAHDCFLLVVGCDRGRLLYVSASVKRMLQYDQSELLGQSLFDILHPKDVAKVKEQLSSSYLSPRERLIDAKTMLPVKADLVTGASRLCPGARRSFLCRIKCKLDSDPPPQPALVKEEDSAKMRKKVNEKKFCVVQCTGYLKLAAPVEVCAVAESGDDGDGSMSCLVAVARALPDPAPAAPSPPAPPTRRLQFVSRHATDGKFVFVDQRVTLALGFLPQELLDTSLYEYVGAGALGAVARAHKAALLSRQPLLTPPFTFRRKDGSLARVQTHFKPFKNPWTKDIEYLVANNTILGETDAALLPDSELGSFDVYKHKANVGEAGASTNEGASDFQSGVSELDLEMQRLIDSQVDSHKIGSAIATEALRRSPPGFSPDLPPDVLHDAVFLQQFSQQRLVGVAAMARWVVLAIASALCADADAGRPARYADYSAARMPQYDSLYDSRADPRAAADDYRDRSDLAAPIDYNSYDQESNDKRSPKSLQEEDLYRLPHSNLRKATIATDDVDADYNLKSEGRLIKNKNSNKRPRNINKIEANDNEDVVRKPKISRNVKNIHQRAHDDEDNEDPADHVEEEHDSGSDSEKNKFVRREVRQNVRRKTFRYTKSSPNVMKRDSDYYDQVEGRQGKEPKKGGSLYSDSDLSPNVPNIESDDVRLTDSSRPLSYMTGEGNQDSATPLSARQKAPLPKPMKKTKAEYIDYHDMSKIEQIKNLPTRKTTARTNGGAPRRWSFRDGFRRRFYITPPQDVEQPAEILTNQPPGNSSAAPNMTTASTLATGTDETFAPLSKDVIDNITAFVNMSKHQLSLAEMSQLSIMKKAQRRDSVKDEMLKDKPPVLLQVTERLQTVVMVEPPPSTLEPWLRARDIAEDSPERIAKVKRFMRNKLVANARNISELMENWDDTVCDYVDISMLDDSGAVWMHHTHCSYVYLLQLIGCAIIAY